MKYLERSNEWTKLEELDLFYFLKRDAAEYLLVIALEMLALLLICFAHGRVVSGIIQLICFAVIMCLCVSEAILARKAKMKIAEVEREIEKRAKKPMIQFDRIKAMNIDDFASLLTSLLHEYDMEIQRKLSEQGWDVSLLELSPEIQTKIHRKFLESEVQNDDR